MILQYFKKKENEYKLIADNIYIDILSKSKELINDRFFKQVNFDSSFEIISIILIFYLKIFKDNNTKKYKIINDLLVKNLIYDLDTTMREIGIGDMSIGKHVKKYVKKFYYRIKIIDPILDNCKEEKISQYLQTLKSIDTDFSSKMAVNLMVIYEKIKKNEEFV
tara:strand:- start:460 stop:951 length:492 start_codon:yes stop_codon:yes gene_type:complete